jgi:hypothetical protein
MEEGDFYLSILIGIIAALIVYMSNFITETIINRWISFGLTITIPFLLFIIFYKYMEFAKKRHKK